MSTDEPITLLLGGIKHGERMSIPLWQIWLECPYLPAWTGGEFPRMKIAKYRRVFLTEHPVYRSRVNVFVHEDLSVDAALELLVNGFGAKENIEP